MAKMLITVEEAEELVQESKDPERRLQDLLLLITAEIERKARNGNTELAFSLNSEESLFQDGIAKALDEAGFSVSRNKESSVTAKSSGQAELDFGVKLIIGWK